MSSAAFATTTMPTRSFRGVTLRFLHKTEKAAWQELVLENEEWLAPWSATDPDTGTVRHPSFRELYRNAPKDAWQGRRFAYVVEYENRLVGVMNINSVVWGATRSAALGYWIDHRMAGRGIAPAAAALALDFALTMLRLHRVEVLIRPENVASIRVVEKLGLREEGIRERFIHIDGDWRDHRCFAITAEEYTDSLISCSDPL